MACVDIFFFFYTRIQCRQKVVTLLSGKANFAHALNPVDGERGSKIHHMTQEDVEFEGAEDDDEAEFPEGLDMYKMVLVVNAELNMGVGKVGAQCAHAAVQLHRMMIDNLQKYGEMLGFWEQFG